MIKIIEIEGLPVTYIDKNKGPVSVFVHGAGANKNYWRGYFEKLKNVRIISPDFYGHGETPPKIFKSSHEINYSYDDDVKIIENITKDLDFPIDLVGHSSGGAICIEYALKFQSNVRSLVLVEPMLPNILKETEKLAFDEVSKAYIDAYSNVKSGNHEKAAYILFEYILGDGEWDKLPPKIKVWMIENVASSLVAHSEASLALPIHLNEYKEINTPTLILYGENTRQPYKKIVKLLSENLGNSRCKEISGASHNSPLTHSHIIYPLMIDLWKNV